jgi:hypothetical protein
VDYHESLPTAGLDTRKKPAIMDFLLHDGKLRMMEKKLTNSW